jgi:hypothetical protein
MHLTLSHIIAQERIAEIRRAAERSRQADHLTPPSRPSGFPRWLAREWANRHRARTATAGTRLPERPAAPATPSPHQAPRRVEGS